MQVIFLQDIPRVGKKYDIKKVSDGYAVNFLFPKKWAVKATAEAIAEIERRKKEIVIEREVQEDLLIKNLDEIKDKIIIIKAKADEKGHLFSAIHEKMLVEAIEKQIKEIGEFEIPIVIKTTADGGASKKSSFKLIVERI